MPYIISGPYQCCLAHILDHWEERHWMIMFSPVIPWEEDFDNVVQLEDWVTEKFVYHLIIETSQKGLVFNLKSFKSVTVIYLSGTLHVWLINLQNLHSLSTGVSLGFIHAYLKSTRLCNTPMSKRKVVRLLKSFIKSFSA